MQSQLSAIAILFGAALAPLPLGAQNATTPSMSCVVRSDRVIPALRSEGITELLHDVVFDCAGGQLPAAGSVIPTVDVSLTLGIGITSRILDTAYGLSEVMLQIDEPGPPPAAPVTPCLFAQGAGPGGCVEYAQIINGIAVASSLTAMVSAPPANTFFGTVQGNQVIFRGVPMLPAAKGTSRVFRISNIRADVAGLGGVVSGNLQVLAKLAVGALPTTPEILVTSYYQSGLRTAVGRSSGRGSVDFSQCGGSTSPVPVDVVQFSERFAGAFKTRTADAADAAESGRQYAVFGRVAGLADFGTRLKAVLHQIPAGVRIFVSTTNVGAATPSAVLVPYETFATSGTPNAPAGEMVELQVENGSATAVWEVVRTNPAETETLAFGVWQQFASNPGGNSPLPGTATVNLSYAPSDSGGDSGALPIGRFADFSVPVNLFRITPCGQRRR